MKKQFLLIFCSVCVMLQAQDYEIPVGKNPKLIEDTDTSFYIQSEGALVWYHKNGKVQQPVYRFLENPDKVALSKGNGSDLYYYFNTGPVCDMVFFDYKILSTNNSFSLKVSRSRQELDEPFIQKIGDSLYLGTGDSLKLYRMVHGQLMILKSYVGYFKTMQYDKSNSRIVLADVLGNVSVLDKSLEVIHTAKLNADHLHINHNCYYLFDLNGKAITRIDKALQPIDTLKNINVSLYYSGWSLFYKKPLLNDSLLILANNTDILVYDTAFVLQRKIVDTASRNGAQLSLYGNQLLVLRDEHLKSFNLKERPRYSKNLQISDVEIYNVSIDVKATPYPNRYILSTSHGTFVKLTNLGSTTIDSLTLSMKWRSGNAIINPFCDESYALEKLSDQKKMGLAPGASIVLDLGEIRKTNFDVIVSTTFPEVIPYTHCVEISLAPDNLIDADHDDNNACVTESIVITSISEATFSATRDVYPNPCADRLQVLCADATTYEIHSTQGDLRQVGMVKDKFIDVSSLAHGMYVLKLRTAEGKVSTAKIVKSE